LYFKDNGKQTLSKIKEENKLRTASEMKYTNVKNKPEKDKPNESKLRQMYNNFPNLTTNGTNIESNEAGYRDEYNKIENENGNINRNHHTIDSTNRRTEENK